ncbi:MAG: cyclic nucleotide-binding domain-containing protein [Deltaproteobacteria bacterium]|nr:cyclic nucleotide-binding domain-containing protein [Deltaproteobacteria bacterium]
MIAIRKEIFQRLKENIQFFHDFSDEELITFLRLMNSKTFFDGDRVFKEHDPGDTMYLLFSGKVVISKRIGKIDGQEKETILAKLEPGECFGEIGLIDHRPRSATARAEGKSLLFSISNDQITKISRNPKYSNLSFKLFRNFAVVLASRLRESNQKIVNLSSGASHGF